jgi:hypothetical protein
MMTVNEIIRAETGKKGGGRMNPIAFCLAFSFSLISLQGIVQASAFLELGPHARLTRTAIVSPGVTEAESGARLKNALASSTGTAADPRG